jgi:glutathione S-transferase
MQFSERNRPMSLVFHYAPYSTACATHWVLEELGMPYDKVKLDLKARDQDRADFRAINPNGKVPVLVHDGTPIFESAAIAIYLGEQFGVAKKVWPEAGPRRAEALKWVVWTNASLAASLMTYLQVADTDHAPAAQRNPVAAAAAKKDVEQLLGVLDKNLAGKTWLLGEQFTLADAHLASFVSWGDMVGFKTAQYPNIAGWLARATARPGCAESMKP